MPSECQICGAPLELLHAGAAGELTAADLSPTCHRPGAHGDLYRCSSCGTVSQEGVPRGQALIALYRDMQDGDYLREEAGRRATARRVLALIEREVAPPGRLLDVGCGHGLLLDEARSRGWTVLGLEPSVAARRHAHEDLGLEVIDGTLASLAAGERFDVVVMADVLEHVDDPALELRRCAGMIGAGGAACVVTPDPGSRTARLAGARWWGFLPAHTFLLPRRTLRAQMERAGLHPVIDVGLRRTFTLRTWAAGLGERGGAFGRVAGAVQRLPVMNASLTLSLGDERVVVARAGVPVTEHSAVRGARTAATA
jgi:SAM-dependent methyltransferase